MPALEQQLDVWVQRLRAIAQTGIAFGPAVWDRERYEEMLVLAAEMAATRPNLTSDATLAQALYERWRSEVGSGIAGYVTPKVGVGAVVFNDRDELLLIERPTHHWLFPTGWADVGYTPPEVAVKEVREETGLLVTPLRLIAVYDIRDLLDTAKPQHFYSLIFYCRLDGGKLTLRPHEALNAGFFAREALPAPLARAEQGWVEHAWAAHRGELVSPYFDPPTDT
ncbi:MAG: NUDIX hydrolase N-terminal domain-containing protein [Anaerolineae bacterium]|nr:NUDIX hydrolase N-terminal domain-containing protein [Anaerolineae bacterium]